MLSKEQSIVYPTHKNPVVQEEIDRYVTLCVFEMLVEGQEKKARKKADETDTVKDWNVAEEWNNLSWELPVRRNYTLGRIAGALSVVNAEGAVE